MVALIGWRLTTMDSAFLKAIGKVITAGVPTIIIGTTTVTVTIATMVTGTATSPGVEAAAVEQSNPALFGDLGLREQAGEEPPVLQDAQPVPREAQPVLQDVPEQ